MHRSDANYLPAVCQTQVAIVRGDYDAAVHDADEILKIRPDSIQGRVMKAAALQRLNKYDDARKLLNDVLDKNPKQWNPCSKSGARPQPKEDEGALDHFAPYEAARKYSGLLEKSKALPDDAHG